MNCDSPLLLLLQEILMPSSNQVAFDSIQIKSHSILVDPYLSCDTPCNLLSLPYLNRFQFSATEGLGWRWICYLE
uniref:Uncharacterized protein n=1 Tax=Arundo donax TaxID=35708 RepID=A0A0A9CZJ8_ARUDO